MQNNLQIYMSLGSGNARRDVTSMSLNCGKRLGLVCAHQCQDLMHLQDAISIQLFREEVKNIWHFNTIGILY